MDIITVKSYYVGDCILEIESKLSQWNELQGNEWNGEKKWKQKKTRYSKPRWKSLRELGEWRWWCSASLSKETLSCGCSVDLTIKTESRAAGNGEKVISNSAYRFELEVERKMSGTAPPAGDCKLLAAGLPRRNCRIVICKRGIG